ncbi:MAG: ChaN family lipoprotein [Elusimicrobiales bacterium]
MKNLIFFLIFFLPFSAWGKSVKKPEANIEKRKAPANAEAPIVLTTSAPNFCIFGGQSGKLQQGEAAFKSVVWRSDVVYVGESHDQSLDHMAQFEALKAMRIARGTKIAVGFEMLNQTLQPVLNDYAEGKIGEEEFLNKIDWKKEWGFDYAMYKPLFDFIVQHKLRALALNVPKKVVGKIARTGLDSLSPEERAFLPEKVEITQHKKYNDYLKATFSDHGGSPMAKMFTLENYLASMAAWNEGMGARVADFLNNNPGWSVLVIAGNGHIFHNAAIPASVKSRVKDVRQASFYTEHAEACPEALPKEHKDLANYIWYIKHPPKPEAVPAVSSAPVSAGAQ